MAAKKKSVFAKFYFLYLLILLLGLIAVFFYVRSVMIEYENSTPDKYILQIISKSGKNDGSIGELLQATCFDAASPGNPTARSKTYYQKITSTKLEVKKTTKNCEGESEAYTVTSDGTPFLTIWLHKDAVVNKLGILNIPQWSLEDVVMRSEFSEENYAAVDEYRTYYVDIVIPEGFSLSIDGTTYSYDEPTEDQLIELKPFSGLYEFSGIPKGIKLHVSGLYFEPTVKVYNNANEEVLVERKSDGVYYAACEYAESAEVKTTLLNAVDPQTISSTWVDFMLNDVGGTRHGLDTVAKTCRIIEGTSQYTKAYQWGTQVDIVFVSDHYKTTKVNYQEKNYVQYNDKLISVDVYFETNIPLTTGTTRTDVFNNRMFFYYIDEQDISAGTTAASAPGWYWVGSYSLEIGTAN